MSLMRDEWFPIVTKKIKAKHGWDTFYYGNTDDGRARGGGARGRGGAPVPRARGARRVVRQEPARRCGAEAQAQPEPREEAHPPCAPQIRRHRAERIPQ